VYTVVDVTNLNRPHLLEELELSRAIFETYEGGVFIHQGLSFIVKEVSHDSKMAKVIRADINWITAPRYVVHLDKFLTTHLRACCRDYT
jgi:DEAD/DEAH box helicase domain-containing protein